MSTPQLSALNTMPENCARLSAAQTFYTVRISRRTLWSESVCIAVAPSLLTPAPKTDQVCFNRIERQNARPKNGDL